MFSQSVLSKNNNLRNRTLIEYLDQKILQNAASPQKRSKSKKNGADMPSQARMATEPDSATQGTTLPSITEKGSLKYSSRVLAQNITLRNYYNKVESMRSRQLKK